jgi:hypothetical protein
MVSQVQFSTHRYMFRNYVNSFLSEDAITQLGALQFSKALDSANHISTYNMSRDMAKALIQQFLWTRLIENSVEPQNRTYRDKGIWRLSSKGLCVLQEFCVNTKSDIGCFVKHVDASAKLMFLIRIERLVENDRLNCQMKYLTSLFAIMIASLPLRHNYNNSINDNKLSSMQSMHSRYMDYSEDGHSVCSSDSESSNSSQLSRGPTFSDYFPHIQIMPNDLLVGVSYRYPQHLNQKSSFQQQRALLQNMNPSSNKFKMRAIFPSLLCCNWLVEYCTVASNDEAESIMTKFLHLGWITFYDKKYRHNDQVESSKSIALNLTREGMKVVVDVSLEKYNKVQQLRTAEVESDSREKRYSFSSSASSYHTDPTYASSTFAYFQSNKSKAYTPSILNSFTPLCDSGFSNTYFDFKTSPFSVELDTNPYVTKVPMNPLLQTPILYNESSNFIKLKAVLINIRYRSLFRDFLRTNNCAENLDFWIDYNRLYRSCCEQNANDVQHELLKGAYSLWDSYLKPGAARELNIDHAFREDMAEEISHLAAIPSVSESLVIMLSWFDKVHDQICKLMTLDHIPEFICTPEYKHLALEIQQEQEKPLKKMSQLSIVSSDFDDFPPPPQRKLKETIFL